MSYAGIFIRQALGQAPPPAPSQGSCDSPDIILCGESDPGPSGFASQASYGTTYPADVYFNNPNYVYLRGYQSNTANGSNLFLYSVPCNLAMWPANWSPLHIAVGSSKQPQNWAWAPPTVANPPVVVCSEALVWTPPPLDPAVPHYCVIAWADNSTAGKPVPPNFNQLSNLSSFDELMYFLATHPNMGWHNTTSHYVPPPANQYTSFITTKDNPETVNITVNFNNITDGTFMVNVTGDVHFTSGPTPLNVANYLGGYQVLPNVGLPFGANQAATLIVTYQLGSTPLGQFSSLSASITHNVSAFMMEKLLAIVEPGVTLPIQQVVVSRGNGMEVQPVFLLGRVQWNLNFSGVESEEL